MTTNRSLVAMAIGLFITSTAGSAFAVPFTPALDAFWIVKDDTEIFRDSFSDGVVPPSGPDGPSTYSVFGPGGMTSESGGKLTMTPSLGDSTLVTTTFADVGTAALRSLSTNSNNGNFLGQDSSFQIHGLYDLTSLPVIPGQSFGIRATDRAPNLGNEGDNTFALFVGMSLGGDVTVFLRHLNFDDPGNAAENAILGSVSIDSLLPGADQIELVFSKPANSDQLSASYILYDYDSVTPIVSQGPVDSAQTIYNNEDYIRGQFATTDRIPVPDPPTLTLFGLGLAGIGFMRRRRAG